MLWNPNVKCRDRSTALHLERHLELTSDLTWPEHHLPELHLPPGNPGPCPVSNRSQVSHQQLQGGSSWVSESTSVETPAGGRKGLRGHLKERSEPAEACALVRRDVEEQLSRFRHLSAEYMSGANSRHMESFRKL